MNRNLLLAIDAGGSLVKATTFEVVTGRSHTVSASVALIRPAPGQTERDLDVLWAATTACVRGVLAEVARGPERILAVGFTGHGNGLYLVDRNGLPARAAVMAADTRAASAVRRWAAAGLDAELQAHSWNGLWAGQPGPILSALARTEPEVLERAYAVVSCKDYLRGRLTGIVATELSDASAGGLYDNTAWAAGHGSQPLDLNEPAIEAFGLAGFRRLLRTPIGSDSVGEVSAEAARATGLLAGTPVVAGMVDNAALHHGSGVFDGSEICVGAGTWSVNQVLVPAAEATMDSILGAIRPSAANIALGEMALLCEASPTSASNFDWALNRAVAGTTNTDRAEGLDIYAARLEREGARAQRLDDPMFLPFLDGSRADAGARGAWVGLSSSNGEGELLGAVVEGICLEHRRHIERLQAALPSRLPVRLSGGATKSPVWCQRFADVLGVPVQISPVSELGSVAAAAIAGVSVGAFADVPTGVRTLNPYWRVFDPDPARADFVATRYQRYCEVAEVFDRLPWGE
ncbi:MAG: carbohydrate kinase [Propionibacteriaceae bacterium]|nr:carbohydrate kinase [Propionibacteriaceae bacterium]